MVKRTPPIYYPKLSIDRIRHYDPASAAKEGRQRWREECADDGDDEDGCSVVNAARKATSNGGATATGAKRRAYGARNADERKERKRSHREQRRHRTRCVNESDEAEKKRGSSSNDKENARLLNNAASKNPCKNKSADKKGSKSKVMDLQEESSVSSAEVDFDVNLDSDDDDSIVEAIAVHSSSFNSGSNNYNNDEDDVTVDYDQMVDFGTHNQKNDEESSSDDDSVQVKRRLFPSSTKKTIVLDDEESSSEEEFSVPIEKEMKGMTGSKLITAAITRGMSKKKKKREEEETTTKETTVKSRAATAASVKTVSHQQSSTARKSSTRGKSGTGNNNNGPSSSSRGGKTSMTITTGAPVPVRAAVTGQSANQKRVGASISTATRSKAKATSDVKKKQAILISHSVTAKTSYAKEQYIRAAEALREEQEEKEESKMVSAGGGNRKKKMSGGKKKEEEEEDEILAKEKIDEFDFTDESEEEEKEATVSQFEPTQGDVSEYNPTQQDNFDAIAENDDNDNKTPVPSLRRSSRIKQISSSTNTAAAVTTTTTSASGHRGRRQLVSKEMVQEQQKQKMAPSNVKGGRNAKPSKKEKESSANVVEAAASRHMSGKEDCKKKYSKNRVELEEESSEEVEEEEEEEKKDENLVLTQIGLTANRDIDEDVEEKESTTNETVHFYECSDDEARTDSKENVDEDSIAANTYNTSKYSFSQHPLLTQGLNNLLDDSSRSELPDDDDKKGGVGCDECTVNTGVEDGLLGGNNKAREETMTKAVATKGRNKSNASRIVRNLSERESNNGGGMQQSSTKSRRGNTTNEVNLNTRSISNVDPGAFLSAYNKSERHSAQSFESPGSHVNNSMKMSSQISLSEEKAKEVVPEKTQLDRGVILQSEITESQNSTKRPRSARLTEEQSRVIDKLMSCSPITKEDTVAIKRLKEELVAVKRKRQKCKKFIEDSNFVAKLDRDLDDFIDNLDLDDE